MRSTALVSLATMLLITLGGCATDPAADKPDATVAPAQPVGEAAPQGDVLTITADSKIGWVGSKVTGSHEGGFTDFDGRITLVGNDPTASSVNVTIDTTSLWSDTEDLTAHLKSADFFDVAAYPTATFQSTSIAAAPTGYVATGNLNLHGVEKSISFPAEIEILDGSVTVRASFSIKRFDFGIVYAGKADNLIRDEVAITFDLRAASL